MTALPTSISLTQRQKRFIRLFAISLIIAFSPSKMFGLISPFIFLGGLIFYVKLTPRKHLLRYAIFFLLYSVGGSLYYLLMAEFSILNFYFFCITASSLLILFCDFRSVATESVLEKLSHITLAILLFQALFGLLQGFVRFLQTRSFDGNNGDFVRGTIEPSFLAAASASNAMFAILISTLFLFIIATSSQKEPFLKLVGYGFILLGWLIASVMHTIIFAAIAVVLAYIINLKFVFRSPTFFITKSRKRQGYRILILFLVLVCTLPVLLPRNFKDLPVYFSNLIDFRDNSVSPKTRITYRTLYNLPEDNTLQPLIGLGPGQFSSRASLILSGQYLRVNIPFAPYMSSAMEQYLWPLYQPFKKGYISGSTRFPFYSWLTVYGEMGLIGLLLFVGLIVRSILHIRSLISTKFPKMPLALLTLLIYIVLLGFQDNYWEFTQAIFPAVLVSILCYTYLKLEKRTKSGDIFSHDSY